MLKKTIKYVNFNEEEVEEDLYFNLTKAEVMEMQLGTAGGYAEYLQKLVASKDVPQIVAAFKKIILKAYGIKSADGRRFEKSEEISKAFEQSEAYSELFMTLIQDAKSCEEFIKGVMPEVPENAKNQALEAKN